MRQRRWRGARGGRSRWRRRSISGYPEGADLFPARSPALWPALQSRQKHNNGRGTAAPKGQYRGLNGGRSLAIERALGELASPWSQLTSPRRQDTDARGFLYAAASGRLSPYGGECLPHTSPLSPWPCWSVN